MPTPTRIARSEAFTELAGDARGRLPGRRNRRIRGKIQVLPDVTRTLDMLEKPI